jgi:hypothetical protein
LNEPADAGKVSVFVGMASCYVSEERLINAFGCAEMVAGSPLWAAHQVF